MKPLHLITVGIFSLLLSFCSSSKKAGANGGSGKVELLDDNTFKLTEVSDDETYGYSAKNAINVAVKKDASGPMNERRFLNALLGPNGEAIEYSRRGSCCPVKSPNAMIGNHVMLDAYEITYEGLSKPIVLYINMYDPGPLKAPKGFTFKQ